MIGGLAGYDEDRLAHARVPVPAAAPKNALAPVKGANNSHGSEKLLVKALSAKAYGLTADSSIDYTHLLSLGVKVGDCVFGLASCMHFSLAGCLHAVQSSQSSIVASSISGNGQWLAYTTLNTLRLFELTNGSDETLTVSKRIIPALPSGTRGVKLTFDAASKKLFVALAHGTVAVYALPTGSDGARVLGYFNALTGKVTGPEYDAGSESADDVTDSETESTGDDSDSDSGSDAGMWG